MLVVDLHFCIRLHAQPCTFYYRSFSIFAIIKPHVLNVMILVLLFHIWEVLGPMSIWVWLSQSRYFSFFSLSVRPCIIIGHDHFQSYTFFFSIHNQELTRVFLKVFRSSTKVDRQHPSALHWTVNIYLTLLHRVRHTPTSNPAWDTEASLCFLPRNFQCTNFCWNRLRPLTLFTLITQVYSAGSRFWKILFKDSLSCSQDPATGPYPESFQNSPSVYVSVSQAGRFTWNFLTKILNAMHHIPHASYVITPTSWVTDINKRTWRWFCLSFVGFYIWKLVVGTDVLWD